MISTCATGARFPFSKIRYAPFKRRQWLIFDLKNLFSTLCKQLAVVFGFE